MRYEIEVDFDDEGRCQDHDVYFGVAGKYNALCIGHDKTHTSTMFIRAKKLNLEKLAKELAEGDIKILSVQKAA